MGSTNLTDVEDSRASVRLYRRHQRHASSAKFRHASQLEQFVDTQATRLGLTDAQVFTKLNKNTAFRISSVANSGQLS